MWHDGRCAQQGGHATHREGVSTMSTKGNVVGGFTEPGRAVMKELAAELKKEAVQGRGRNQATEELDVLNEIPAIPDADRAVAERIHAIVTETADDLSSKLWYGQPAYARNGKVVCFFRSGDVDGDRHSTLSHHRGELRRHHGPVAHLVRRHQTHL